ncbi:hypothetical protein M9H77_10892 [Catharanthus roseus]|uniref:Uncharacterized protein n=1 Tax=Catharanthus roseus TaxID=4058 RepID=A0ACC0BD28_CATRO|nr:hypothetical protein M9H77_10892 [Catharanthus roseus]
MQVYAIMPKSVLRLRLSISVVHPSKLPCTTAYTKIQDLCFQGFLLHVVTRKVAKRQPHIKKSLNKFNPMLFRPNPLSLNRIVHVHPVGLLRLHHKSSEMCESPPYCNTGIDCARNAYTEDL